MSHKYLQIKIGLESADDCMSQRTGEFGPWRGSTDQVTDLQATPAV